MICKGYGVEPLFPEGGWDRKTAVYLHASIEEAKAVRQLLPACPAVLIDIYNNDWNRDFSPWPAPRAFHGGEAFSGGAPDYLKFFAGELVPAAEALLPSRPSCRLLAGYSLAGLFAVYAACRTGLFSAAASVSGSLWYDGFTDRFAQERPPFVPERLYFSIGDRESHTSNSRLAAAEICARQAQALFAEWGSRTLFETNPGGHFDDPAGRTARGIAWMLSDKK